MKRDLDADARANRNTIAPRRIEAPLLRRSDRRRGERLGAFVDEYFGDGSVRVDGETKGDRCVTNCAFRVRRGRLAIYRRRLEDDQRRRHPQTGLRCVDLFRLY
jgi:hypothetical protein